MYIRRSKLDFIQGLTIPLAGTPQQREAKFSGKHREHIFFIIDEGDAVPDEVYRGIESCLSGGSLARLLVLFNPRRASGPVYFMERDEVANVVEINALSHPNVVSGDNIIPGAVTRDTTVRRINEWTVPIPLGDQLNSDSFKVPEYLEGFQAKTYKKDDFYPPLPSGYRRVVNPSFSYMVLAKYPSRSEEQLISQEWIDKAVRNYRNYTRRTGLFHVPGIRPIMGVDLAESEQGDLTVATLRYNYFVAPQVVWNGMDAIRNGNTAADIYIPAHARYANVDCSGLGSGTVVTMMGRGCKANRVMVQSAVNEKYLTQEMKDLGRFNKLRDQMMWMMREWLRTDEHAAIPDDKDLHEELIAPNYGKHPVTGKITMESTDDIKEKIGRSPDRFMSLMMTFAPVDGAFSSEVHSFDYLGGIKDARYPF